MRRLLRHKKLTKLLLRFAARFRRPRLAARVLHWNANVLRASKGPARHRVLALNVNKDGFLQDVLECFREGDEFEIFGWPAFALPTIGERLLSPRVSNDTYMSDDPEIVSSKDYYRTFIGVVLDRLRELEGIDAVVASNFHYSVQREFAAALEERGIPFVVLHKENLKSPGRVAFWRYMYERRGNFSGRKILVYNSIERDLQLAAKVVGEDKVVTIGMPRMDRIHRWRREAEALARARRSNGADRDCARQVLFFAFDRLDKLPSVDRVVIDPESDMAKQWGDLSWAEISEGTHYAVVELARRRPDIRVVVKTKGIERQREDVDRMLKALADPLPANLTVVNGGDAFRSLTESNVVIGFNSTAQLEAIAAGKPLIVPWFAEALAPGTRDFAVDLGDAVTYARSPEEIVELASAMVDASDGAPLDIDAAASEALIRWTGNDDGGAGRRALEVFRAEIAKPRPAASA